MPLFVGTRRILRPVPSTAAAAVTAVYWNSADKGSFVTLSNSDYTASIPVLGGVRGISSKSSGKWYLEATHVSSGGDAWLGVANSSQSLNDYVSGGTNALILYLEFGSSDGSDSSASYGAITDGTRIMMAVSFTDSKVWYGTAGTWFDSGNPATNTGGLTLPTGTLFPFGGGSSGPETVTLASTLNHSPPSGFSQWGA